MLRRTIPETAASRGKVIFKGRSVVDGMERIRAALRRLRIPYVDLGCTVCMREIGDYSSTTYCRGCDEERLTAQK